MLFVSMISKSQGLEKIIVEKYYISDENDAKAAKEGHLPAGSVTYRIFADMRYGYKFQAAYGVPNHEMRIATTTLFYNNDEFGATISNDVKGQDLKYGTAMLDSWVSVAAGASNYFGVPKSMDDTVRTIKNANDPAVLQNKDPKAGIPISVRDGLKAASPQLAATLFGLEKEINNCFGNKPDKTNGPVFSTRNGSWASFGGAIGPDTNNIVLIAQITTDGQLTFELNLQLGTPTGDVEQYVARNPENKEILYSGLIYPEPIANKAPTVSIKNPKPGKTFKKEELLPIQVQAADEDGKIVTVEFYINGQKVAEDNTKPYAFNWSPNLIGPINITAIAMDNVGVRTTSKPVQVIVK